MNLEQDLARAFARKASTADVRPDPELLQRAHAVGIASRSGASGARRHLLATAAVLVLAIATVAVATALLDSGRGELATVETHVVAGSDTTSLGPLPAATPAPESAESRALYPVQRFVCTDQLFGGDDRMSIDVGSGDPVTECSGAYERAGREPMDDPVALLVSHQIGVVVTDRGTQDLDLIMEGTSAVELARGVVVDFEAAERLAAVLGAVERSDCLGPDEAVAMIEMALADEGFDDWTVQLHDPTSGEWFAGTNGFVLCAVPIEDVATETITVVAVGAVPSSEFERQMAIETGDRDCATLDDVAAAYALYRTNRFPPHDVELRWVSADAVARDGCVYWSAVDQPDETLTIFVADPAADTWFDPVTCTHPVGPGETLDSVALLYDVSVAELVAVNDPDFLVELSVGAALAIPGTFDCDVAGVVPPRFHVVVPGDNPSTVAERYGVTIEALVAANPGVIETFVVGQVLRLPAPP